MSRLCGLSARDLQSRKLAGQSLPFGPGEGTVPRVQGNDYINGYMVFNHLMHEKRTNKDNMLRVCQY